MTQAKFFNRKTFAISIPIVLLSVFILLSKSSFYSLYIAELSKWIMLDILVTIPVLYLLAVWGTNISKLTVLPLLIIGLWLITFLVPVEHQGIFPAVRTGLYFIIESVIAITIVMKIRKVIKEYKAKKTLHMGFMNAAHEAVATIFPVKMISIVMSEVAVFYYVFGNWDRTELAENEFTYHLRSGTLTLLYVLIGLFVVEASVVHYIAAKWNVTVAWVLTIVTVYTLFQLLAFIWSIGKNPIVMGNDELVLRYGYLRKVIIPWSNIESIALSRKSVSNDEQCRKLSPIADLESHNVLIHLHESAEITGAYAYRKKAKCIALWVDEAEVFKSRIEKEA